MVFTDMKEWKHGLDALENPLIFLQHMIDTFPYPLFLLRYSVALSWLQLSLCNPDLKKT
jgi:hypothetical protein